MDEAEKKNVVDDIGNVNTVWTFKKDPSCAKFSHSKLLVENTGGLCFHKTRLSDEQERLRMAIDLNRRLFHKYVRTIRVLEELLPSVYPMNMLIFKIGVLWSHWRWRVSESKSNEKNTGLTIPFLVRNLTERDYNYSF